MIDEIYRFKVGIFECMAVSDGTHTYTPPIFPPPAISLFSNVPKENLQQILMEYNMQQENWMEFVSPYTCLFIDTGDHKVLVDTGAGNLGPNTGKLLKNLQSERVTPEEIDTVIFTHAHPDHIGGNTVEGKITFPNARFIIGS